MSRRRRLAPLVALFAVALVGLLIDRWTKYLALTKLVDGRARDLLGDWLQLRLLHNPGAAFSTGTGMTVVFAVLAAVVLVVVLVFVVPRVQSWLWAVIVGLGLAGVAGNLWDRLAQPPAPWRGYVVDFLSVKYFAVFNVADIFLTTAAILIVLDAVWWHVDWRGRRSDRQPEASSSAGAADPPIDPIS
ncbi:MAG: signal peptidase II [Propionibacteriaceae bacterium]|jgi:signal peptidase II|nr:signal peptidase II [Propionibacteriaceae bacterium]